VRGDSERKFAKACGGDDDALILDLEDSVAEGEKDAARALVAVMPHGPDGIVLPKCERPDDLR